MSGCVGVGCFLGRGCGEEDYVGDGIGRSGLGGCGGDEGGEG